jgi:hypothetical protein
MHTHIKAFEAKHNVGYRTFVLLILFAVEINVFASLGMIGQDTLISPETSYASHVDNS